MAHQTCFLLSLFLFPILIAAISHCGGPCQTGDDCNGRLTCINGRCDDDPDIGTHFCSSGSSPSPNPPSSGGGGGRGHPATLTNNNFSKGGDGGGPSACDGNFHSNSESIVVLSTRWYAGGSRCFKKIHITAAENGRSTDAMVMDECDVNGGCGTSIVDGSNQVWYNLGLDIDKGVVSVTWTDASLINSSSLYNRAFYNY